MGCPANPNKKHRDAEKHENMRDPEIFK